MRRLLLLATALTLAGPVLAQQPGPGPAPLLGLTVRLASPPPIGSTLPNTGAFSTVTAGTTYGTTRSSTSTAKMFDTYIGDATHAWFTGGLFASGYRPTTSAVAGLRPLSLQRDAAYTGAASGNPSALSVVTNVGSGVTGLENAVVAQTNISATDGVYTAGQFATFKNASGSGAFGGNIFVHETTGRMSSVSGSLVGNETDIVASGPDDAGTRVNQDVIFFEDQTSGDGATTFAYGGIRVRGSALLKSAGVARGPASTTYGFAAATLSGTGLVGSYGSAFYSDGSATTAYNATSATQTLVTSATALIGATTLVFTTSASIPGYAWPGSVISGTNIAAGTKVVSSTWNGTTAITVVIDTPTTGAIASSASYVFTNAFGTGFKASGQFNTAALSLTTQYGAEASVLNGMTLGAPTGGVKGVGTLNATGLYIGGAAAQTNIHPGYIANDYYLPWGYGPTSGAAAAVGTTTTACSFGNALYDVTLSALIANVSTLEANKHAQLAIYTNGSWGRPGSLIASTTDLSTTSTGVISGSISQAIKAGPYWFCYQTDSALVIIRSQSASTEPTIPALVGSSSTGAIVGSATIAGVSIAGTYGTWPTFSSGTVWSDIVTNIAPWLGFKVASSP